MLKYSLTENLLTECPDDYSAPNFRGFRNLEALKNYKLPVSPWKGAGRMLKSALLTIVFVLLGSLATNTLQAQNDIVIEAEEVGEYGVHVGTPGSVNHHKSMLNSK